MNPALLPAAAVLILLLAVLCVEADVTPIGL
jgi:hypothetical protein